MQLDTQDNASQEHSILSPAVVMSHNNDIGESSVMRNVTESGRPHSTFLEARNGNPGYEKETSPYELVTGTIIPARLITSIDSTVPGGIVKAEIIESIFDSKTHSLVVLPQGTIAIGYTDQAHNGEARLVAAWTEFYLPNGRKFFASSNEGAGGKGEAGMPVSVDTHAGRAFGNALVGSVLQAGVNLASRATTIDISTAGNSVQAQRLAPTFHAYPGQLFNIVLNHDLPLDRYIENEE
jgi:type IV secretion system protein VirB10